MTMRTYVPMTEGNYESVRIFRNKKTKYSPAFLGYRGVNIEILKITGFPARQLDEIFRPEYDGSFFDFTVIKKHSETFNKDYLVLTDMVMHNHSKQKIQQTNLKINED